MEVANSSFDTADCLVCNTPIEAYGIFGCGHFLCDQCAARLRKNDKTGLCPVCRSPVTEVVLTPIPPPSFDAFSPSQLKDIRAACHWNNIVKCYVADEVIENRLNLLCGYFCPITSCWEIAEDGSQSQEPFRTMGLLHDHLWAEHKLKYCRVCLENRPIFLSEHNTYTDAELDKHCKGICAKDDGGFSGHPACLFCQKRFFDGDGLLKHMQLAHMSCDTCNSTEFTFVFYKDRPALLSHFDRVHKLCTHRDCVALDPMLRVFATDIELQAHMQRKHGETAKLDLSSLGFRFGVNDRSSRPTPAAAATGEPLGAANAASTHANRIHFDFINRMESVVTTKESQVVQRHTTVTQDANKQLKDELQKRLPPAKFEQFKLQSGAFLQGRMLTTEYFAALIDLFPERQQLDSIFDLISASIPDPQKREALIATRSMMLSKEAEKRRLAEKEARDKKELEELRRVNAQMKGGKKGGKGSQGSAWTTGGAAAAPPAKSPATKPSPWTPVAAPPPGAAVTPGWGSASPPSTLRSPPVLSDAPLLPGTTGLRGGAALAAAPALPPATHVDPDLFPALLSDKKPKPGGKHQKPTTVWVKKK